MSFYQPRTRYAVTGFIGRGGGQYLAPVTNVDGLQQEGYINSRKALILARLQLALDELPTSYDDAEDGELYLNNGTLTVKE